MSESKGCSAVVVGLVAVLMLVIGVAAGGAVMWFYAGEPVDDVVDSPAAEVPVTTPEPVPPPKSEDGGYAALLPLEETLQIEGPMPPEAVKEAVLGGKRFKLRDCYAEGVGRNPDLKGEMSLQFTVAGSNGKVTAAVERHTNFSDTKVRDCILKEVKSWKFPPQDKQSVVRFDVLMMPMSGADTK